MRSTTSKILCSLVVFVLTASLSGNAFAQKDEEGFKPLFNGTDLSGWQGATDGYHVVDGELVGREGVGGVLFTEEQFTDFEVRLDFALPPAGNNGLAIRYPGTGRASVDAMCEIQLLDDDSEKYKTLDPRQYTGAVYGMVAPTRGHLKPQGEWNSMSVIVKGSTITIDLNGAKIIDADISKVTEFKDNTVHPGKDRKSGYFGFAGHSDPVRFRNIRIKRLDPISIASFTLDVTIPKNHRCMGVLPQKSISVSDPLYVHGFVLMGSGKPIVVAAVDWCEIRNASYDLWRDTIAEVVGTTRERVLVSSLHQHDAPVIDHEAAKLLDGVGLANELFDAEFHLQVLQRLKETIALAMTKPIPVTDVGYAETVVQKIASNRRIVGGDGSVSFARGSSSGRDPQMRELPEGLIDDKLRTLSFWQGTKCLLEYHAYATHPMSFYGKGIVSSDFVGLARQRRQRDDRSVHQIYASGCSGDVTAGRYNDGTPESREQLIDRLYQAMVEARANTKKMPFAEVQLRAVPLELEYTKDPKLQPDELRKELMDSSLPVEKRILAAMGIASAERVAEKRAIDLPMIDFGISRLVLFPGESFVGYQHIVQEYSRDCPVIPVGYGECWTGYLPTESAFRDGFNESWLWVSPGSEDRIRAALSKLFGK